MKSPAAGGIGTTSTTSTVPAAEVGPVGVEEVMSVLFRHDVVVLAAVHEADGHLRVSVASLGFKADQADLVQVDHDDGLAIAALFLDFVDPTHGRLFFRAVFEFVSSITRGRRISYSLGDLCDTIVKTLANEIEKANWS
jgi:hypothetical protein